MDVLFFTFPLFIWRKTFFEEKRKEFLKMKLILAFLCLYVLLAVARADSLRRRAYISGASYKGSFMGVTSGSEYTDEEDGYEGDEEYSGREEEDYVPQDEALYTDDEGSQGEKVQEKGCFPRKPCSSLTGCPPPCSSSVTQVTKTRTCLQSTTVTVASIQTTTVTNVSIEQNTLTSYSLTTVTVPLTQITVTASTSTLTQFSLSTTDLVVTNVSLSTTTATLTKYHVVTKRLTCCETPTTTTCNPCMPFRTLHAQPSTTCQNIVIPVPQCASSYAKKAPLDTTEETDDKLPVLTSQKSSKWNRIPRADVVFSQDLGKALAKVAKQPTDEAWYLPDPKRYPAWTIQLKAGQSNNPHDYDYSCKGVSIKEQGLSLTGKTVGLRWVDPESGGRSKVDLFRVLSYHPHTYYPKANDQKSKNTPFDANDLEDYADDDDQDEKAAYEEEYDSAPENHVLGNNVTIKKVATVDMPHGFHPSATFLNDNLWVASVNGRGQVLLLHPDLCQGHNKNRPVFVDQALRTKPPRAALDLNNQALAILQSCDVPSPVANCGPSREQFTVKVIHLRKRTIAKITVVELPCEPTGVILSKEGFMLVSLVDGTGLVYPLVDEDGMLPTVGCPVCLPLLLAPKEALFLDGPAGTVIEVGQDPCQCPRFIDINKWSRTPSPDQSCPISSRNHDTTEDNDGEDHGDWQCSPWPYRGDFYALPIEHCKYSQLYAAATEYLTVSSLTLLDWQSINGIPGGSVGSGRRRRKASDSETYTNQDYLQFAGVKARWVDFGTIRRHED